MGNREGTPLGRVTARWAGLAAGALALAVGSDARADATNTTATATTVAVATAPTTSRVVVFGAPAATSIRVRASSSFRRGQAGAPEVLPPPRGLDPERLELTCPIGTACEIRLQTAEGRTRVAEILALDERVEVDVAMAGDDAEALRVSYRDPDAASAAMAELVADARALAVACDAVATDPGLARAAQAALWDRARDPTALPLVADVAALALAEGRCVAMADDATITETVLALASHVDAVTWWPGGLVRAAGEVEPERGWATIDTAVASLVEPERAGHLLFAAYVAAQRNGDDDDRDRALARLRDPALARTAGRRAAETQERFRSRLHPR